MNTEASAVSQRKSIHSLIMSVITSPSATISSLIARGDRGLGPFWLYCLLGMLNAGISSAFYALQGQAYGIEINIFANVIIAVLVAAFVGSVSTFLLAFTFDFYALPIDATTGASTKSGIRATVYWSIFPFIIRQLVRLGFLIFARSPILSAGMSGFLLQNGGLSTFMTGCLQHVDIFMVWQLCIMYRLTAPFQPSKGKRFIGITVGILASLAMRGFANLFILFPILYP